MGPLAILVVRRVVRKLLKHLSLHNVPAPLQPRPPQLGRQRLQRLEIVRLPGQQRRVVRDPRWDKGIVLRVLPRLVPPVDEQPLDVPMPRPARIAGVVDPLGKIVDAPQARGDLPHPQLLQLGGLVQKDHIVLRSLIPIQVPVAPAVPELQNTAVAEHEPLVARPVLRHLRQLPPQEGQMVGLQLRQAPPHQQQPDARIPQRQQLCLAPHRPAFAAAPRAAEGNVLFPAL